VRPDLVVVVTEPVELGLELLDRSRLVLAGEEALQGLMEPLDLATGLRVVGAGVDKADPEPRALELERAPPATGRRGEHCTVVGEQRRREAVDRSGSVEARDDVGGLEDRLPSEATSNRE
jgi:hypothetical protein